MSSAGMYGPSAEEEAARLRAKGLLRSEVPKAKATRVRKKEKPILEQVAIFLARMIERDCGCCCTSVNAEKMLRKIQNDQKNKS